MSTNKKRFTVLNEAEILAEEVKKFPCLYDKSSCSYRNRGVVRDAWVEVAKKLELVLLTHNFPKPHEHNILTMEVYVL